MTDKLIDLTARVNQLNTLLKTAKNTKILWEEIKIVSDKAFTLQDEIIGMLDELETTEKDLIKLQSLFDTREIVWDVVAKIATREMEVKEKTTKNRMNAHEKKPAKTCECGHNHSCGCAHNHNECGCHGTHEDECGCGHHECGCGGKK